MRGVASWRRGGALDSEIRHGHFLKSTCDIGPTTSSDRGIHARGGDFNLSYRDV